MDIGYSMDSQLGGLGKARCIVMHVAWPSAGGGRLYYSSDNSKLPLSLNNWCQGIFMLWNHCVMEIICVGVASSRVFQEGECCLRSPRECSLPMGVNDCSVVAALG